MKDVVPERDSNPRSSGRKVSTLSMRHHAPLSSLAVGIEEGIENLDCSDGMSLQRRVTVWGMARMVSSNRPTSKTVTR